jgi:hypothetical protein
VAAPAGSNLIFPVFSKDNLDLLLLQVIRPMASRCKTGSRAVESGQSCFARNPVTGLLSCRMAVLLQFPVGHGVQPFEPGMRPVKLPSICTTASAALSLLCA